MNININMVVVDMRRDDFKLVLNVMVVLLELFEELFFEEFGLV